jgi:hypothetical protein
MKKQFATVVQPSRSIEGPRIITSVSTTARWEQTGTDGNSCTFLLKSETAYKRQLPPGCRLTLLPSAPHPVMVTGLEPAPWVPAEVTVTVIG